MKLEDQLVPAHLTTYGLSDDCPENDARHAEWYQERTEQGFDSTEMWNLDGTISRFILPRLKYFRDNIVPGVEKDPVYHEQLNDAIAMFELVGAGENNIYPRSPSWNKYQKGMKAFQDIFLSLWC